MSEKVVVAWSGGKDSALALYEILNSDSIDYNVIKLLTTIEKSYNRISIHNVRRILIQKQAEALQIPLGEILILKGASNAKYETTLLKTLKSYRDNGVSSVIFGDIFLDDIRKYREYILAKVGLKGVFPLWKKDTKLLSRVFLDLGFKAIITSVDSYFIEKDFVGREYDEKLLLDLPAKVDPCGENGEFHTFVYDGPIFRTKVGFKKGAITFRNNRFYCCDLLPNS